MLLGRGNGPEQEANWWGQFDGWGTGWGSSPEEVEPRSKGVPLAAGRAELAIANALESRSLRGDRSFFAVE